MTWSVTLLAVLLVGAFVVPVAMVRAQEEMVSPAERKPTEQAVTTTRSATPPSQVFGKVVDVKGKPIAQARLKGADWSAESGPDGLFPLPALHAGESQEVTITAQGFVERENVTLWGNGNSEQKVIELHRDGRLEGRVIGPDGKPLAGAPLSVSVNELYPDAGLLKGNAVRGISDRE